ncbi:MAG: site-specific DNA-methyltransferase [Bacteroidales bacterium]|nr:site-specific DNA-methyltransferase [Bacteroidales bacterium]
MEKLRMKSGDAVDGNVAKIAALFPQCVTERLNKDGKPELAIDFDKLRAELSKDVLDEGEERYQFTWPDKRAASRLANTPTDKTLRPDVDASKDFWNTENLYIEGDNLDVLKVLRENYLGAIKMIYIDPPYNTGNDFLYNDDFAQGREEFEANSGLFDEDGNQLTDPMQRNTESNGRFHTDWLNMIYPRLKVARDLLTKDGLIFISMDENELENLKKVCNEIFGEQNHLTPFIWHLPRGINAGVIARAHEYILVYCKDIQSVRNFNRIGDEEYSIERCNKKIDSRHPESTISFPAGIRYEGENKTFTGIIEGSERISIIGEMVFEDGKLVKPITLSAGWTMKSMIESWLRGEVVYDTKGQPIEEFFFKENGKLYSKKRMNTFSIKSVLKDMPDTQKARIEVAELLGSQDIFPYPKTTELVKLFSKLLTDKNDTILDFFSGSATTAHAVMKLNAEDGGKRKFIMVQLPEVTDEKSEARKAGYESICQIGEERIRRAGEKVKEEAGLQGQGLDVGFRVLKLDSSNMEDVFYTPEDFNEQHLFNYVDNVKSDRTPLDLLFQVLPELGIELSAKIEERDVNGKKVFFVDGTYLIATFDTEVNESTVTEIAKMKPQYFVMRDASAANDNVLDNFEQIFKHYSPDTIRKIL